MTAVIAFSYSQFRITLGISRDLTKATSLLQSAPSSLLTEMS